MSILGAIKGALGFKAVRIGDLDKAIAARPVRPEYRPVTPPPPQPAPAPQDPIAWIEEQQGYQDALQLLEQGSPFVFVTGGAGTGKSTFIRYLRTKLPQKNVVVVAPTGVAAINCGGQTIHSFFKLPWRVVFPRDVKKQPDDRLYKSIDILVIDEVSMVRADLVDAMDRFLRLHGRDKSLPFGGCQVVAVGDLYQLPPIVDKTDRKPFTSLRYRTPYFFSARGLQDVMMSKVELSGSRRHRNDQEFEEMLNVVRVAERDDEAPSRINDQWAPLLPDGKAPITLTCRIKRAAEINDSKLRELRGGVRVYKARAEGSFATQGDRTPDRLPVPWELRLKPGTHVMFVKNDPGGRWVNGTLGVVRRLDPGRIQVELATGQQAGPYDVMPATWESYEYRYDEETKQVISDVVGRYVQFPLILAWAISIHKSQGKTLERIHVDLGEPGAFAAGQVYVALSRCPSLDGITLKRPIRPKEIFSDPQVKDFYQRLEDAQIREPESEEDYL